MLVAPAFSMAFPTSLLSFEASSEERDKSDRAANTITNGVFWKEFGDETRLPPETPTAQPSSRCSA